jgi:catechol 2,3-dioxygenase-like lactoylglutathione lyase family enzyme
METKIDTQAVNRLMMLTINVGNMAETKAFYADKLGLKVKTDYRIDDNNWWVSLAFPDGEATLTLARSGAFPENIKPGTLSLYFETSDVVMAHDELAGKHEASRLAAGSESRRLYRGTPGRI